MSKNKVAIPPPKFHDLSCEARAKSDLSSRAIWEIGVPAKHSLYWSILLPYLYLSNDSDLEKYLQKTTGDDKEVDQIKQQKKLGSEPLNIELIKKQLKRFNPFKNRHASFIQAKEMEKVFRIFKLRLNRYATELRKKFDVWNDDFILNAASLLLECEIEVHFPDETTHQKIEIYPKSPHEFNIRIILFQYENQQHGLRSEKINVFRFGMPDEQANSRKIDALVHFLKTANISGGFIVKVRKLMEKSENHGKSFLTTILENECGDILQEIYRSPYTAVKISEAGFETNPLECSTKKFSVFCQSVLFSKCSKNFFILFDYASNCRSLFDHSVRRASDNVLESIKKIKSVLEKDVSELSTDENSKISSVQMSVCILEQFIIYAEYQIKVASDLNNLKKNFESSEKLEMDKFKFRKSVIKSILTHYQSYSYCNLDRQLFHTMTISDKFSNFLRYSDYYKNVDSFGCISFFDNFYQLRLLIGLKQENVFLNIEWKMFAAILFNNFFSERDLGTESNLAFDEKKRQDANVLRHVPLLHRNVLQAEIPSFLEKLETASDSESLQKSLKNSGSRNDSNALPQVIDVLLKIRIEQHIQAALEVSPGEDGIKSILVIERALQVIGESIKPPSVSSSIISFLLRSCLSDNLQNHLKFIRNDLSHERCNSAYGRLKTEQNFDFFRRMQEEIAQIKRHFEIVFFTQSLRIEESAIFSCINEIGNELEQDVRKAFFNEYKLLVDKRVKIYEEHHGKCVELLFDILSDLQNRVGKAKREEIMGQLKAANYLLNFICRHTTSVTDLNNLKVATGFFVSGLENMEMEIFENEVRFFLSKWIRVLQRNNIIGQCPFSAPAIESFFTLLKSDLFSIDEESQIKAAVEQAYEEAIYANNSLVNLFSNISSEIENFEIWLKRIFIPVDKIASIKYYFENKEFAKALSLIKGVRFSKNLLEKDLKEMFGLKSGTSPYFMVLLTKITYQKYLSSPIYTSVRLSDHILEKLEFFLTKKVHILIERMKSLRNILIDEDDEIQKVWTWGKSKAMKHHMKFLMRQRYIRDVTVRASLDMAFFDCVNILHKSDLSDLYEKSTDLFSGIDLRNVLAHRTNIPETIGGILDEDDFPSVMIEKMLELIDDLEAVESIFNLFPKIGILEEKYFVDWINNASDGTFKKEIKAIRECERWERYLFLFPFIKC